MDIQVENVNYQVKVLFTEAELKQRIDILAQKINTQYSAEEPLVILVILHGALLFAADLVRGLTMPTEIESVRLKSYHGTQSTGKVELVGAIPPGIRGKNVLLVEDIVDSGRSLSFLIPKLKDEGAKSVKVATLLDKPSAHQVPITPEFIGFSIGKNFVIGYGLDLDGRYRNLPYVAELVKY